MKLPNKMFRYPFGEYATTLFQDRQIAHKLHKPPEILTSWVKWHGPYTSYEDWVNAGSKFDDREKYPDQRQRLYMALGKSHWFSLKPPKPLYVGMSSKEAGALEARLRAKRDPSRPSDNKKLWSKINEYWIGEVLSEWEKQFSLTLDVDDDGCPIIESETLEILDTKDHGLTKYTESALIFALNPTQNYRDYQGAPEFSFFVLNTICTDETRIPKKRRKMFGKLIPTFFVFDKQADRLSSGSIDIKIEKQVSVQKIIEQRKHKNVDAKKRQNNWYNQLWQK